MGGHLIDNQIDFVDFFPFLTIIFGASLLAAGLFTDGSLPSLSSFGNIIGLNNGNLIIGRQELNNGRLKRSTHLRAIPDNNIR